MGDEALLKRAVMNLLDNAIKYTHPGGRVGVRTARSGDACRVEVSDTGPGVPAAAREQIFERFYRAAVNGDHGPRPGGAGLGLPIARWVARAHGGDVRLAESDGVGSTFVLEVSTAGRASTP